MPAWLKQYVGKSEAELKCMTLGALSVWGLIAPERFGQKMRPINGRSGLVCNKLREMLHPKPGWGLRGGDGFRPGYKGRKHRFGIRKPRRRQDSAA